MKQSILLFSLLSFLLAGSSFIDFPSSSVQKSLEEITSLTIDIDYPKTINVGEEFTLKIKDTKGFEAVSGSHSWIVLGSSKGSISINGASATNVIEPLVRAVSPGKVDLLLTVRNKPSSALTLETTINQIVTIQILH